ncbi:MAG: TraB/GumN family protein [Erythrobacter sp.]
MRHIVSLLLGTLAIAGCDRAPSPLAEGEPHPALWEVRAANGEVEGWLFGTVHALPDRTRWRWAKLDEVLEEADLLVVEVANLDDDAAMAREFQALAFDKPALPLRDRVSPELRDEFDLLLSRSGAASSDLDRMESWAAALALAQLDQAGGQENGVDRALLKAFEDRRIVELEGAAAQLAIFDRLPEKEQRDLLDAVVLEATGDGAAEASMPEDWRRGDLEKLARNTTSGILADPELRVALLEDRNKAWAIEIARILDGEDRPIIAVGAGHLIGRDSLAELLEKRGYTVHRAE